MVSNVSTKIRSHPLGDSWCGDGRFEREKLLDSKRIFPDLIVPSSPLDLNLPWEDGLGEGAGKGIHFESCWSLLSDVLVLCLCGEIVNRWSEESLRNANFNDVPGHHRLGLVVMHLWHC